MPTEPRENTPTPDPTILTTEALARGLDAQRDYIDSQLAIRDQRLTGMDEATRVLNQTVTRVPTDMQQAIGNLRDVMSERFDSISTQFRERDTRQERESRDNKVAVDAAFAAQKEAAAKQDEANSKAIDKSEAATKETINKLAELFTSSIDGIGIQISDLKQRVQALESERRGGREAKTDTAVSNNLVLGILGVLLTVVLLGVSIYAATH